MQTSHIKRVKGNAQRALSHTAAAACLWPPHAWRAAQAAGDWRRYRPAYQFGLHKALATAAYAELAARDMTGQTCHEAMHALNFGSALPCNPQLPALHLSDVALAFLTCQRLLEAWAAKHDIVHFRGFTTSACVCRR